MGKFRLRKLFNPPWRRPFWVCVGAFLLYLYLNRRAVNPSPPLLDLIVIVFLTIAWIGFFSQFVLPVKTIHERMQAFFRLLIYPLGLHGQAISIIDGEIKKRKGEEQKNGPGVILLDTASAALLKKPTQYMRAIGPGVTFTKRREAVTPESVVDLHLHKQTIGPTLHAALSPFAEKGKKETAGEYQARQRERNETRALTRDGIEIVSTITVYFKLESRPGEGNTQFGFRPESVEKAILGQNIDLNLPPDAAERIRRWDWLPAYLAADVWREYLGKFTLDELFQRNAGQPSATAAILRMVRARMMEDHVTAMNDFGAETGEMIESREYHLLKKRGIQVTRVEINNLLIPEEVESQLVKRWNASWLIRARQERVLVDRQRDYILKQGQTEAHTRFAESASQPFLSETGGEVLTGRQVLLRLLRGSLEMCDRDPALHSLAVEETAQLQDLIDWVEKQADL